MSQKAISVSELVGHASSPAAPSARRRDEAEVGRVRAVVRAGLLGGGVASIFAIPAGLVVGLCAEWPMGVASQAHWYAAAVTAAASASVVVIGALLGSLYGVISLQGHEEGAGTNPLVPAKRAG